MTGLGGFVRDPRHRRRARTVMLASAVLLLSVAAPAAATPVARPAGAATPAGLEDLPPIGSGGSIHLPVRSDDPVQGTIRDLERLMDRIVAAKPRAGRARSRIVEYHLDPRRGVVRVGVDRVTPPLTRAAARTFGDSVELHRADRYHRMSRRYRTSRGDDPVPHKAGAAIETELGECTSGFGVRRRGATYFLGTAHCFRGAGTEVINNGRWYGRVAARRLGDRGPDASLVASEFGPEVYVGGPVGEASRVIRGARTPVYGGRLCTSGAKTGKACAGRRQEDDLCVRFGDGVTTCNLTRAVSVDGRSLVQPGDSGGPVYAGGTRAVGIIVGGTRDGTELLYHPIGYLLELWDSRLLTSRP